MNQKLLFYINLIFLGSISFKSMLVGLFLTTVFHLLSKIVLRTRHAVVNLYLYILCSSITLLILYKYFLISEALTPLLFVSYIYLQCVGYLLEVSRGQDVLNFLDFANSNLFFIKSLAGPIERPHEFAKGLDNFRLDPIFNMQNVPLLILGFLKKSLADCVPLLALSADSYGNHYLVSWTKGFLLLFQVYCDFSGYTSIAIAIASMLGITLSENFNKPWKANSLSDFWQRWHMSLTSWSRDYIFSPLLSYWKVHFQFTQKNVKFFVWFATFITFIQIGIWHKFNLLSIFWAFLNSIFIIFPPKLFKKSLTFIVVVFLNTLMLGTADLIQQISSLQTYSLLSDIRLNLSIIMITVFTIGVLAYLDFSETVIRRPSSGYLKTGIIFLNTFILALVINPITAVIYGRF